MKKLFILSISLLAFGISQAQHKNKKKKSCVKVVKIVPQGEHEGLKVYAVLLSDGKVMDYMYQSEIKEAKRTGIWKYNEDLEFNKK